MYTAKKDKYGSLWSVWYNNNVCCIVCNTQDEAEGIVKELTLKIRSN